MTSKKGAANGAVRPARSAVPRVGPATEDSFGFLVCDSARYVKRMLYARLAPYGVPGRCWFVLRALWQRDGVSQRELSVTLGLAEPPLMMTLRTMEELDLVTRERDSVDKRRVYILLTKRARRMEKELVGVATDVNRAMLAALSASDRAIMVSALRSVHTQLAATSNGDSPSTERAAVTEQATNPKVATLSRPDAVRPSTSPMRKVAK